MYNDLEPTEQNEKPFQWGHHWGEIDDIKCTQKEPPDVSDDINRAMDSCCLNEFDTDDEDEIQEKTQHIQFPPVNPLVLHAITLHRYANQVNDEISRISELYRSTDDIKPLGLASSIPPLPQMPVIEPKFIPNDFDYIHKEFTDFSMGKDVHMCELSEDVVKKLLEKSVATLFAHIGYEYMPQSLMDIMADVLSEFYKKICTSLKIAVEDEDQHNSSGFPHVLERTLSQIGMGGARNLTDFYQIRVVRYAQVLQKRCEVLKENYENLLTQPQRTHHRRRTDHEQSSEVYVKIEKEDSDDNPELLFHLPDGDVSNSEAFHLLHALEDFDNVSSTSGENSDPGQFPNKKKKY